MRTLDIRRHTMRRKPGAHLSREGIALARLVGQRAPDFDRVITSTVPRAIETAIAMGFEVQELVEEFGQVPEDVMKLVGWPKTFEQVAMTLSEPGPGATFADTIARLWQAIAERLPDGGHGLIITHGLFIELGTLASLPKRPPASWGGPIGYCEGVRLTYDNACQRGEILRVPPEYQLTDN